MQVLGISVEDWLAVLTIIVTVCTALIKGFKWAFHSAYKEESENNRKTFEKLSDTVNTLNETVTELRTDLSKNNETINRHERQILALQFKTGLKKEDDVDDDD